MTVYKVARLNRQVPVTGDGASGPFARVWDQVAGALEKLVPDQATTAATLSALGKAAALLTGNNVFTGANIFRQRPSSDAGYIVQNKQVVGPQDDGWTDGTGTPSKGAFAAYAGQTVNGSYNQAQVQAIDNAAKAASQRLLAIEQALKAHGLIGS